MEPTFGDEALMQKQVRVLIMREREYLVAQCLEYDIAVQARTLDDVVQRFQEFVTDHVILATEHGDAPLSGLEPAPQSYEHQWTNASRLGMLQATMEFNLSVHTDQPVPERAVMAIS